MKNLLFILCFSFFVGHELDAMTQSEWRLLYGLRDLESGTAEPLFVLLHVPLFALLLWLVTHANANLRTRSRLLLAGFAVVHAGLHYNLRHEQLYTFNSWLSQGLILGCGALGLACVLLYLPALKLQPNA